MKLYNPNKLNVGPVVMLLGLMAVAAPFIMGHQIVTAVTTPDCGNSPNVVEGYLQGTVRKPGNSVACPDVANLIANPGKLFHPTPAKDECPADFTAAVNAGLASPTYRGTCDQLAKMVKVRTDSGVWPK